jgi:hypothetical protein
MHLYCTYIVPRRAAGKQPGVWYGVSTQGDATQVQGALATSKEEWPRCAFFLLPGKEMPCRNDHMGVWF